MSYASREVATTGAPVELYRFASFRQYANLIDGDSPPWVEGALVVRDDFATAIADWPLLASSLVLYSECDFSGPGWCLDIDPKSWWRSGRSWLQMHCRPTVLLGQSGGATYRGRTFGGLVPGRTYVVLVNALGASFPNPDIFGIPDFGAGGNGLWTAEGGINYVDFSGQWARLLTNTVATPSGTITVYLGNRDIEIGDSVTDVTFRYLRIYDPTLPPESGIDAGIERGAPMRYTSADETITYNAEDYVPALITRGSYGRGSNETDSESLELVMDRDHPVIAMIRLGNPQAPIGCTVYRLQRAELASAVTSFIGQVQTVRFQGRQATVVLQSVRSLLTRVTPRYVTSRSCPFTFGDPYTCQKSPLGLELPGAEVTAVSADGLSLTVTGVDAFAGPDATFFLNGVIKAPGRTPGTVIGQPGSDVLTLFAACDFEVGDLVDVYPGCDKTVATCATKFDNIRHYGGEPAMPPRNPFSGSGLA